MRSRRSVSPRLRPNLNRAYKDTRSELRKITWPTREETIRLTLVVIVLSIAMALFLGVIVDELFFWIYRQLVGL